VSYANTGHWSEKAIIEAKFIGNGRDYSFRYFYEVHEPIKVERNE
jgi:hypothetical protein